VVTRWLLPLPGTPELSAPWYLVSSAQTFNTALRRHILMKWQQDWNHTQGNKLWDVKSVTHPWRSSYCSIHLDEVVVTCLRVGQTHLTRSHLLSANPPPVCAPCNAELSVRHILLDCTRYTVRHQRFHLPSTISDMLGDNPEILALVLAFLCAIDIYRLLWFMTCMWIVYQTIIVCFN
jgi:hypothetical protein